MKSKQLKSSDITKFKMHLYEEEKSQATIEKYIRDINKFYEFLGKDKMLSKEVVVAYKKSLMETHKTASINSMLVAVNRLLLFINLPQLRVKILKMQRQLFREESKELTRPEYQRLLKAAKNNEKLYMLIQTLCATGVRVSEHQYITRESLNKGKTTISNKGKVRHIPLSKDLVVLLKKYCEVNNIVSGPIFITCTGKPLDRSNIWKMMKRLCKEANVEQSKVFPHNLRHLFGFTYYGLEKDLVRLGDILGHSSIETTRIYTKTSHYRYESVFQKMKLLDT